MQTEQVVSTKQDRPKIQKRVAPTKAELGFDTSEGYGWVLVIPATMASMAAILLYLGRITG